MVPKEESAFGVRVGQWWEDKKNEMYLGEILKNYLPCHMDIRIWWELILYFKNLCWVIFYPIRLRTIGPIPTQPTTPQILPASRAQLSTYHRTVGTNCC